ncbi:MAG: hypothetical protein KBH99_08600 [Syntrophobacteraceae bacterium]|nr:hypothetical protein [Syntrophobacteraceae bacterium]
MSLFRVGSRLESNILPDEHCVRWENMAYGGIVPTVPDKTMGWTVIMFRIVSIQGGI